MSKKNKKKNVMTKEILDMSYRKKIDIDTNREYSDEELVSLIIEMNKQLQKLNDLHKELYSSNAYIERICQRTFWDILYEKIISIFGNVSSKKEHKVVKKKLVS